MRIIYPYPFVIVLLIFIIGCKVEQPVADSREEPSAEKDTVLVDPEPVLPEISPPEYRASETRLFDLLHTRLEVRFDWENQRLEGRALLHLKPYFYDQQTLLLDAKNFDVHEVRLVRGTERQDLEYFYDNLQLLILLDTVYTRNDEVFVEIDYTAKPTERETGGSEAITSDQGLYFINPDGSEEGKPKQIWTQGETESNSFWFPTIDAPNERMTQELYITVDQRYTTLSNGELIYSKFNNDSTRTDLWRMEKPHAPYLVMMAIGEFEVIEDQWRDVPLTYYIEPEYAEYAKDIFGATPEMMEFFSNLLGVDYPWSKYAQVVVRDYVSGAMENTTASLYYDALLVDSRELLDYDFEGIIAHELFHQWFGDLVTLESWANLTLNEGFANYSEYLWNEYKYGTFEAGLHNLEEKDQYFEEARSEQKDLIRFYYDDKDDMFDSHSYAKGGRILHMLRKYIGDEAFFLSLKKYLEEHQFSSVEVHELRLIFEEVTGEDLNWFFNQWFLASGHPVLEVADSYEEGVVRLTVSQLQDLETNPLYRLPLYVDIWTDGEKDRYYIEVDKPYQVFEFEVDKAPDLVLFDGEQQLLAEIDHPKSQEEYIYQYRHSDEFQAKYEALDTLLADPDDSLNREVFMTALSDPFWYFRQMAVNALEDYALPLPEEGEVAQRLVSMARHDEKSLVRADALQYLFERFGPGYEDVYREALNDSSYMVAGTALYIYSAIKPEAMAGIARRFEGYNNINIVIPLASYFIDAGGYDRYDWFTGKIRSADSESLWYLLQYFGEYLMDAPVLMQRRGIAVLERFARKHRKMYVRLAAYQSLGLLSDLEGVDELRADIREQESDEYLRQLYQSFP